MKKYTNKIDFNQSSVDNSILTAKLSKILFENIIVPKPLNNTKLTFLLIGKELTDLIASIRIYCQQRSMPYSIFTIGTANIISRIDENIRAINITNMNDLVLDNSYIDIVIIDGVLNNLDVIEIDDTEWKQIRTPELLNLRMQYKPSFPLLLNIGAINLIQSIGKALKHYGSLYVIEQELSEKSEILEETDLILKSKVDYKQLINGARTEGLIPERYNLQSFINSKTPNEIVTFSAEETKDLSLYEILIFKKLMVSAKDVSLSVLKNVM